jgi:hypothetical protein
LQEIFSDSVRRRLTIVQHKVLRDVPFGTFEPLAFHADDLYCQCPRRRYAIIQDVSWYGGKPHHNRIATWLREQSLCKIMRKTCIHFQVALQNSVRFGMHTSERMATISEGLFIDKPKGRDQSLGGLGLIGAVRPMDYIGREF